MLHALLFYNVTLHSTVAALLKATAAKNASDQDQNFCVDVL